MNYKLGETNMRKAALAITAGLVLLSVPNDRAVAQTAKPTPAVNSKPTPVNTNCGDNGYVDNWGTCQKRKCPPGQVNVGRRGVASCVAK
jgi:hypothetical protein